MKIDVTEGFNIISIGYSEIGSYLKIKKPVSLIWYDCAGSIGQYLSMMPCSEDERKLLHEKITGSLYQNFTGRLDELYSSLQPLFELFENGEYHLSYVDGTKKRMISRNNSNPVEIDWLVAYPKVVNLSLIDHYRNNYKEDKRARGLEEFNEDLVGFTSSYIFNSGGDDIYIASRPQTEINNDRVAFFEEKIANGDRPFVILMEAFYQPDHSRSGKFILDGHHKLQAYQNLNIAPPCVTIMRNFYKTDEPEFDMENLAKHLYPWQTQHILDNWDGKDTYIIDKLKNPNSPLHQFIKNGLVKQYHENNQLKHQAFYINDKVDGQSLGWYDNGQLKYEHYYDKGKRIEVWKDYYPSGNLQYIQPFNKNNNYDGELISYYENGQIRWIQSKRDGQNIDGNTYIGWFENGIREVELKYLNGKIIERKNWDPYGRVISHELFDAEKKSSCSRGNEKLPKI